MQTINLKQYYPFCKEDIFVEVSDEIVEAFLLDKRAEAARDRKMFRYSPRPCPRLAWLPGQPCAARCCLPGWFLWFFPLVTAF